MESTFEQELKALETNQNIRSKLIIFSLYYEIYKYLTSQIEKEHQESYSRFLEKVFVSLLSCIDENCQNITPREFMINYLRVIRMNDLSNTIQLNYAIATLEEQLTSLEQKMNYISEIDKYSFSLSTKSNIMLIFRDFINHVISTLNDTSGERRKNELGPKIFQVLNSRLLFYLTRSTKAQLSEEEIIENLEQELSRTVKRYLVENIDTDFGIKIDLGTFLFLDSCSETERKLFKMTAVYAISKDTTSDLERIEELSRVLGVSKEEYLKIESDFLKKYEAYKRGSYSGEEFGDNSSGERKLKKITQELS